MLSRLLVNLWVLVYGRLGLRGSGGLIRIFYPLLPGLKRYPIEVPGLGTVYLDFGDGSGFRMLLPLKYRKLEHDAGLFRAIETSLPEQGVLWDIGAFVGHVSGYFAHPKYRLAAIQAFEPNPASLARVQGLLRNCKIATVYPFGLGEEDAQLPLAVNARAASTASLVMPVEGAEKVTIQIRRGDDVQKEKNLPLPHVIKIDVEGFEPKVLAGLAKTIAASRPVIVFEHIFFSEEELRAMQPGDYRTLFIRDDGTISDRWDQRQSGHDAVFLPNEKAKVAERLISGSTH